MNRFCSLVLHRGKIISLKYKFHCKTFWNKWFKSESSYPYFNIFLTKNLEYLLFAMASKSSKINKVLRWRFLYFVHMSPSIFIWEHNSPPLPREMIPLPPGKWSWVTSKTFQKVKFTFKLVKQSLLLLFISVFDTTLHYSSRVVFENHLQVKQKTC